MSDVVMAVKKENEIEFVEIEKDKIYLNTPLVKMLYYIYLELREIKSVLKKGEQTQTQTQKPQKKTTSNNN